MKKILLSTFFLLLSTTFLLAQKKGKEINYKTIEVPLKMEILYPNAFAEGEKLPAIVFYHGGGWRNGNLNAFRRQAEYFNSRGVITVLVEYRIETVHGTTPFESVKDARSAMRYLVSNSDSLGIDKTKIIASGGSAGGHLAVSLAQLDSINDENDNLEISTMPFALFLFNPVLDTGIKGFGYRKFEERYKEISPIEHIHENLPPTLIMVGTKDKVLPQEIAENYKKRMLESKNRCELVFYENQEHSFFNWGKQPDHKYFFETLIEADNFLVSLNILSGKENVKDFFENQH